MLDVEVFVVECKLWFKLQSLSF